MHPTPTRSPTCDIQTVNGDWGPQSFPVVPGHGIVGVHSEGRAEVTRHRGASRTLAERLCGDEPCWTLVIWWWEHH